MCHVHTIGLGAHMGLVENLNSKILLVHQITLDKIIGERNGRVWDMLFFFWEFVMWD